MIPAYANPRHRLAEHPPSQHTALSIDAAVVLRASWPRAFNSSAVVGGKPIIRDLCIAIQHVLGMLAAGDTADTILSQIPILELLHPQL